jgi:uncharacterized protein DUF4288
VRRKQVKWFGVRTLYRVEAFGRPVAKDKHFDSSLTLVEERVVLVRARTHAEAIRKAEREAKRYAAFVSWRNPYGQRLKQRYLGACNSFELSDPPGGGTEVYSDTFLAKKSVSDRKLLANRALVAESKTLKAKRRNFLAEEFNNPAGA